MLRSIFEFGHSIEHLSHSDNYLGVRPVAAAKQDQAWTGGSGESKQTRILEVRRDDRAHLVSRSEACTVVALIPQQLRQGRG
jgi:hypothetical protein